MLSGPTFVADLEKCLQELISENLLILLRDRPHPELKTSISSNFFRFLLAGQITGTSLIYKNPKNINEIPQKEPQKITEPALSKINSVVFSARTVVLGACPRAAPYRSSGPFCQGNPKGGLANGGLARKAPIGPKRALSGQFLLFPRGGGVRRNRSRSAPKRPR